MCVYWRGGEIKQGYAKTWSREGDDIMETLIKELKSEGVKANVYYINAFP